MRDPVQPITKRQALANLRTILAGLFSETADIRRVADDAELDSAQIDFAGAPIRVWAAVLAEAARTDKVMQVAEVAAAQYEEERQRLTAAAEAYADAQPDPPDLRPWLLLAAGAVAVLAIAAYLWVARPWEYIEPMSAQGDFNLAVARFAVVDAVGQSRDDCVADLASEWIDDTLRKPVGGAPQQIIDDVRGPAQIGVVAEAQAAQLAEKIKATVVVYGVITATGLVYSLQPAFYVRDTARVFDYGGELAGPNQLGQPIEFELPPEFDCNALTEEDMGMVDRALSDRLATLGYTITGLAFFFQEQYVDAAYWFDLSVRQYAQQKDAAGQAVANMLLGAASLRQATPADPANQATHLADAERAFARAVESDDDYSRAYLGLGITALERAKIYDQLGVEVMLIRPDELVTATHAFTMALAAADQPPLAYVPAKAALGIGIAHLLGAQHDLPGWSVTEAVTQFNVVTATLAGSGAAGLKPVAALAYGYLGIVAQRNGDWEAMKNNCQRTILLLAQSGAQPDARTTAEAWGCVAIADKAMGKYCDALTDYESALQTGSRERAEKTVVPAAKLERWRVSVNDLRLLCDGGTEQP